MIQLFIDGGVVGKNPSKVAGTWAARLVYDGVVIRESSGVITPKDAGLPSITNNLTEILALVKGLEMLSSNRVCTVYSDSQVTLGRAFQGWKWNNIPPWLHQLYRAQRDRLIWDEIAWVLLAGHPTKAQLSAGKGRHGLPVSVHNVWCDHACQEAGQAYLISQMEPVV